jgi:hypothetical protein
MLAQTDDIPPPEFGSDQYPPELFDETKFWLFDLFWSAVGFAQFAFVIWMIIECLRKDPDRFLWLWVILILQPIGPWIYFFVRWLPSSDFRLPKGMQRWSRGKELHRLEAAAMQIGNAHQFIQLGDALRETSRPVRAGRAYGEALAKEPENQQALWGASHVDFEQKQYESALPRLERLLEIDPQYKFGDVSLLCGKTLYEMGDRARARSHLEKHVQRWRHPESLFLLATLEAESGHLAKARSTLQSMLMDINGSPRAIARKHVLWKSKARKLLRKLPRGDKQG